ncbi:hypothetical protein LCGC14_2168300 [marine sediment metagenome]|uniref:Uncharacterized protein n=1 Tax=marine sediment metagenome TaxID=412755 RepID=A0A0F9DQM9_9ZZZZ
MLVNLRGPSGAGKSFIGHKLLDTFPHEEIWVDGWNKTRPKLVAYELPGGLFVLGRYTAKGGGLDGFLTKRTRDQFYDLIEEYGCTKPFVFAEALIISSSKTRWQELAAKMAPDPLVFAFMDTPFDLCIKQVYIRNGGRQIKEEQVLTHHRFLKRLTVRLKSEGENVVTIDHTCGFDQVVELFRAAGWTG